MSVFSPLDPRGPDQRRKQLIAKLAQQAGSARGAVGRIPMPPRVGAAMSEGRAFHNAADGRQGGRTNVTQSPNILQSVLAKLGVLGHSHAEEASQGHGLPIAPPALNQGLPIPAQGSAIPVPGDGSGPIGSADMPRGTGGMGGPQPFTASGPTAPGEVGGATSVVGPSHTVVDPGFYTQNSGPIPLGNGLYYDPTTGTVLGTPQTNDAGTVARPLAGRGYNA